jgi:hypothetical protein
MPTTPVSRERVLSLSLVASFAYVPSSIACLVGLEVIEALRPSLRHRSSVTVMRIKAVVDMSVKAVRAVKPGASAKKQPSNKPIGAVITVRSTVVWGIVEIPIRAHGSRSDIYANRNLGRRRRYTA